MPFNPKQAYQIVEDLITIKDFSDYSEDFVTRPPYQRKNVWATKKKQNLLDSLFRRYYIPKIVVREVRLGETKTINEIIDGQQRIIAAQEFIQNKLRLPESLKDISPDLPGKYYKELNVELMSRVVTSDPSSISNFATSGCPKYDASINAVHPSLFWALTSTPASINFFTTAKSPTVTDLMNTF